MDKHLCSVHAVKPVAIDPLLYYVQGCALLVFSSYKKYEEDIRSDNNQAHTIKNLTTQLNTKLVIKSEKKNCGNCECIKKYSILNIMNEVITEVMYLSSEGGVLAIAYPSSKEFTASSANSAGGFFAADMCTRDSPMDHQWGFQS